MTTIVLSIQILISILFVLKFKITIYTVISLISLFLLIHIFIVDKREMLIPYLSIIGLFILGLIGLFINNETYSFISLNDKVIGTICFIIIWISLTIIQNKLKIEFLGGGDLMYFCVISLLFGWQIVILGIFIASIIALLVETIKKRNTKVFPYGPYLVIGTIISILIIDYLYELMI